MSAIIRFGTYVPNSHSPNSHTSANKLSRAVSHPLQEFVEYCQHHIKGDEKGEAQIFLDRLFTAFGHADGLKGAGAELEFRLKKEVQRGTSFADLVWKKRVLIEMKKRGEDLDIHIQQAINYWLLLAGDRPQYIVLCNFAEFWIYDTNKSVYKPVDTVTLAQLPTRANAFGFLRPTATTPVFGSGAEDVTAPAAEKVAAVFNSLVKTGTPRPDALRYCLQCIIALFAEDVDLLPNQLFSRLIEECSEQKGNSYDLLGGLFQEMNRPGLTPAGRYKDVDYFNGGLFAQVVPIELTDYQISQLQFAAKRSWRRVNPSIFGSIFEAGLEKGERHVLGAHYTHEIDIKKIVDPVIVQPWSDRIEAAQTLDDLYNLLTALCAFRVLDPACGSGNFLFMAFREMKLLEKRLLTLVRDRSTTREEGRRLQAFLDTYPFVNTRQFFGIDVKPYAVELAKVTLMIAKELSHVDNTESYDAKFAALPLDNLEANIICADALLDGDQPRQWPDADVIIGNPPYQSKNKMQQELGAGYLNHLRAAYPEVPGRADFCVYWFYKAHKHLNDGARAGLVATNTIRQNYSREGSLDYIVNNGGTIFNAVNSQDWSGDAAVFVSVVNWIKGEFPGDKLLYFYDAQNHLQSVVQPIINSSLSLEVDVATAEILLCHQSQPIKICFSRPSTHGNEGYMVPA